MAQPAKRFILNAEQRVYVEKSWGHEDWITNGRYCGKKLHVKKGKACSFHHHRVKDEVMYLESGKIVLTYGWDEDPTHAAQGSGDQLQVEPIGHREERGRRRWLKPAMGGCRRRGPGCACW